MSSVQERVKLAIYKRLLEEEKMKNKRISMFSVAVFFIGVVSVSSYNSLYKTTDIKNNQVAYVSSKEADDLVVNMYEKEILNKKHKTELNPDDLFVYNTQI